MLGANSVYLDYAAASPIPPPVAEYVRANVYSFCNPSAYYQRARYNWKAIENTREKIAEMIHCSPNEIIFTSGCSEANALAIKGYLDRDLKRRMWCSAIEHSSVLEASKHYPTTVIECNNKGYVEAKTIKDLNINKGDLVAVQHANNEIGSIQPIKDISEEVHKKGALMLVDAAQTFGHLEIDVDDLGIDMLSVSASKIGGIRGVGFLYVRNGIDLSPLIFGTQENGIRGGTYFDLGIGAFGVALEQIDFLKEIPIRAKRNYLIEQLLAIDNIKLNGTRSNRLAGNVNVRIENCRLDGQQLVGILGSYGFMVSSGSACHAGAGSVSHVLKAMGLSDEECKTTLRITIGKDTTVQELNDFVECLKLTLRIHKKK